jgi:two-component sensor histidine kinase
VWGDRTLGVLNVLDSPPRCFIQEDIAILERFTPLAAAALEQTRLLDQAQTRWREAETLRKASAAITETLSLDETLDRILEQLSQVVSYDRATIQLLRNGYLEVVNERGYQKTNVVKGLRFSVPGDNVNAQVIESRQPVILHNTHRPYLSDFQKVEGPIVSWLGVPLILREQVIGILTLDSNQSTFNDSHSQLVLPFANQVAVAIENARLYEQARRDAETKSVLLKEVNHRVKNNLAAIIGLLYAERHHAGIDQQSSYQAIIEDMVNRVQGLATVHSLLSASEWKPILLSEMVTKIIHSSLRALPFNQQVSVEVFPSPIRVTANQANSLALIINELTTNTFKYGLSTQATGQIIVHITLEEGGKAAEQPSSSENSLQSQGAMVVLEFRDNGPGYPANVLNLKHQNVGLYLVQTLVRQELKGDLTLYNDCGGVTVVRFKAMITGRET